MTSVRKSIDTLYKQAGQSGGRTPRTAARLDALKNLATGEPSGKVAPTIGTPASPAAPPVPTAGTASGDGKKQSRGPVDLGDLKKMVKQAIAEESAQEAQPATQPKRPDGTTDMEQAMQNIADAVLKASGGRAASDTDSLKSDLVETMRQELESMVRADLMPMVRSIVAEVLAEQREKKKTAAAAPVARTVPRKPSAIDTSAGADVKASPAPKRKRQRVKIVVIKKGDKKKS